jgi:HSP20 family protein
MTTMARFNPVKHTFRFDPVVAFDDLFRGLGVRPMAREFDLAPDIRIDVAEDEKFYRVTAEIPGVEKKDIEISVERNEVTIGAEVRRATPVKEQKDLYTERYYGKVFRSFTLPGELDSTKADAHYEHGILTLMLPKKSNGGSRRIAIG